MKKTLLLVLALVASTSFAQDAVPGEALARVRSFYGFASKAIFAAAGATAVEDLGIAGVQRIEAPSESIAMLTAVGTRLPFFDYVEPNYLGRKAQVVPTDPDYATMQYAPQQVRAPWAWLTTTGTRNVRVAVLDAWFDTSHPEFAGRIVHPWNVVTASSDVEPPVHLFPRDQLNHGTHVLGIIGASANNGLGIAGMAWNVELMPVNIFYMPNAFESATYKYSDLVKGLAYIGEMGAHVVNMSIGGGFSFAVSDACSALYEQGTLLVAAAGNSNTDLPSYPAANPSVLSVGSVKRGTPLKAWYSNYGSWVHLAAPGGDGPGEPHQIWSTSIDNDGGSAYELLSGTSMASPLVAGLAALVFSVLPDAPAWLVWYILTETADPNIETDSEGHPVFQKGQVHAERALALAREFLPKSLEANPASIRAEQGGFLQGTAQVSRLFADDGRSVEISLRSLRPNPEAAMSIEFVAESQPSNPTELRVEWQYEATGGTTLSAHLWDYSARRFVSVPVALGAGTASLRVASPARFISQGRVRARLGAKRTDNALGSMVWLAVDHAVARVTTPGRPLP